jgi:hypothetical protein
MRMDARRDAAANVDNLRKASNEADAASGATRKHVVPGEADV